MLGVLTFEYFIALGLLDSECWPVIMLERWQQLKLLSIDRLCKAQAGCHAAAA